MATVFIDGVEYVPKADILPLTDERVIECLKVLTSMRYFNQSHKMMAHTYDAIRVLSPELADLEPDVAFERIHGSCE